MNNTVIGIDFTKPPSTSFIRWHCARKSINQSRNCKSILTNGSSNTILSKLTRQSLLRENADGNSHRRQPRLQGKVFKLDQT